MLVEARRTALLGAASHNFDLPVPVALICLPEALELPATRVFPLLSPLTLKLIVFRSFVVTCSPCKKSMRTILLRPFLLKGGTQTIALVSYRNLCRPLSSRPRMYIFHHGGLRAGRFVGGRSASGSAGRAGLGWDDSRYARR